MEVDKKEAAVISNAIQFWQDSGKVSQELADDLRNSYQLRDSNVDTITWYAFISAVSCGLLAFGALVIDEKWIELLRNKWGFSETVVGIGFSLVAVVFVILAKRRKLKHPTARASNETYTITIILSVAIAIAYWTRSFAYFEGNYARPLLIAAIVYFVSAAYLGAQLLWTVMLLTLAGWWGAQTYFWTGGAYRFAGMNYPLNMTLFGLVIWAFSWIVEKIEGLKPFSTVTYSIGLFLFCWQPGPFPSLEIMMTWIGGRPSGRELCGIGRLVIPSFWRHLSPMLSKQKTMCSVIWASFFFSLTFIPVILNISGTERTKAFSLLYLRFHFGSLAKKPNNGEIRKRNWPDIEIKK